MPSGDVRHRFLRAIQESRRTLDVAVHNFTALTLAEALSAAKVRGLHSWVLVDQAKAEEGRSGLRQVRSNGLTVRSLGLVEQSLRTSQGS